MSADGSSGWIKSSGSADAVVSGCSTPADLSFSIAPDRHCSLASIIDTTDISTLTTYLLGPPAGIRPPSLSALDDQSQPAKPAASEVQAVAWIDQDGVGDIDLGLHGADFGRVMLTRFSVVTDRDGTGVGLVGDGSNVVRLTGTGSDKFSPGTLVSANDNVVWVGDEDGTGIGGVIGRDAQAVALVNGDTIVTWVDADGSINGKAYASASADQDDDDAESIENAATTILNGLLSGIATLAADQRYRLVETGRDSFAILWAATLAGAIVIQGQNFKASDEQGGAWTVSHTRTIEVGPDFDLNQDFQVLGWSTDQSVVTVAYENDGDAAQVAPRVDLGAGLYIATLATPVGVESDARAIGSSTPYGRVADGQVNPVDAGPSAENTTQPQVASARLHAGVVENASLVVADNADSVLVGSDANDVILADIPDAEWTAAEPIAGGNDEVRAGEGNDVIYGGGGDDIIDGGTNSTGQPETDTAIFTGNSQRYSITVNGDGSYTVVLASSDTGTGIDRGMAGFEGVDTVSGIEQYQFLDGDVGYLKALFNGADITTLDTSKHGVVLASDLYRIPDRDAEGGSHAHDGTPTAWGLTRDHDGRVENEVHIASVGDDTDTAAGTPIVSAMSGGGFAVGYIDDGQLHISTFDILGRQDGSATSSAAIDTTTAAVMDATGDGVAIAYVSSDETGAIGVEVLGDGHSCDRSTARIAVDGDVSELAIAGSNDGDMVNVAWVESDHSDDPDEAGGDIVVQRLEISRHDDDGALREVGMDGKSGHGSDSAETIGTGRAPAITETSDDGFAVAWVGNDGTSEEPIEHVEGQVFGSDGIVVDTFVLPVGTNRHIREGSGPTLETTGDGDLFIAWEEIDEEAGGLAIMSALLRQLGPSEWSAPIIRELRKLDDEPSEISIAVSGANGDAIIVTWRHDGDGEGAIVGQRFSVEAIANGAEEITVGVTFDVTAQGSTDGSRDNINVAGLDDGRVVVVSREIAHGDEDTPSGITVQATLLDTRDPADILISEGQGAAQDTHVGTVGDDIIDGRANTDELYGALGDDVLTGGTGDDRLDGGDGDDTLVAGSGTDHLDGGDGDDLLMGGFGRDYIHGGDGEDTVSYRGETRSVTVDLAEGVVRSDAEYNAVVRPSRNVDVQGISTTTFFDTGVEDVLGRIETTNRGSDGGVEFHAGHEIENAEGGLGADNLLGDNSNNVLTGGKGNDLLDGRGGVDTAAFSGNSADYDIELLADGSVSVHHARNTSAGYDDGTDTLRNIETVSFADAAFELRSDATLSPASIAAAFGIVSEISVAAIECFDFTDLDDLDDHHYEKGGDHNSGSGSSGNSSSSYPEAFSAADLCGLGSDTLYFGDLDALCPALPARGDHNELFDDGLDYGACTVFASSAEIEAAMCLDGPDSLDALTTIDAYLSRNDNCDPTEFRLG